MSATGKKLDPATLLDRVTKIERVVPEESEHTVILDQEDTGANLGGVEVPPTWNLQEADSESGGAKSPLT